MRIFVDVIDTSTWVLEDTTFFCEHDGDTTVETYTHDTMGFNGHEQYETQGYECVGCGEPVDGDPVEDREEALADLQIMEALGK